MIGDSGEVVIEEDNHQVEQRKAGGDLYVLQEPSVCEKVSERSLQGPVVVKLWLMTTDNDNCEVVFDH